MIFEEPEGTSRNVAAPRSVRCTQRLAETNKKALIRSWMLQPIAIIPALSARMLRVWSRANSFSSNLLAGEKE